MNFNAQIAEAFKMFQAILNKTFQNPTNFGQQISGMKMNESIFGAGFNQGNLPQTFGLQNMSIKDEDIMKAFGFQKSNNAGNQSVESLQKQVQTAIANSKSALAKISSSSNPSDQDMTAHTDTTIELENLKGAIDQALGNASEADKPKLTELLKQLENEIQTQNQAHREVISSPQEQKDAEIYNKTIGDDRAALERFNNLLDSADGAKTREQINQSISEITAENDKYQKLSSDIKEHAGIKEIIDQRTAGLTQKLAMLKSKLSGLGTEEQ